MTSKPMAFKLRTNAKHFSNEELLEDLKRVARLLGKESISQTDYRLKGKFTHKNFYKRFSSWNNSLIKAGLVITVDKKISTDDLFDNLEAIWRKLGRQPYYGEIRKPLSRYVVDTYCRRFGGWHKAREAFIKYKGNNLEFIGCGKSKATVISRANNEKTRLKIFKRDNYSCVICGKSPALQRGVALHVDQI